jgi:hypothetical protein
MIIHALKCILLDYTFMLPEYNMKCIRSTGLEKCEIGKNRIEWNLFSCHRSFTGLNHECQTRHNRKIILASKTYININTVIQTKCRVREGRSHASNVHLCLEASQLHHRCQLQDCSETMQRVLPARRLQNDYT